MSQVGLHQLALQFVVSSVEKVSVVLTKWDESFNRVVQTCTIQKLSDMKLQRCEGIPATTSQEREMKYQYNSNIVLVQFFSCI